MSGHTPGPWYVYEGPPNGIAVHWSPDGQICPLRWTDGLRPDVTARVKADANLIAAAPDLLAALKTARRVLEVACGIEAPYIREAFKAIDPAIAKAEGVEVTR